MVGGGREREGREGEWEREREREREGEEKREEVHSTKGTSAILYTTTHHLLPLS